MSGDVRLVGEQELARKLRAGLAAPAAARFLLDAWRFDVERGAKGNIARGPGGWLWKGTTRRSLTSERDPAAFPRYARVGSNQDAARWGEYGTGLLSEDPQSAHRRYFPPPRALDAWAADHGFTNGYAVAAAISRRGGTAPRRFLRTAAEAAQGKIDGWLDEAARLVEAKAPGL